MRLYVGIEVGEAWTAELGRAASRLRGPLGSAARWVRPEQYHVTVVFLGDQQPADLHIIGESLSEAAGTLSPFALHMLDVRHLGGHERGALVAGVADPSGSLQAYRRRLDAALRERGVRFDSKPLRPHVTLARPRGRGGLALAAAIDLTGTPPLGVTEIHLVRSELLPSGSRYTSLLSVSLSV